MLTLKQHQKLMETVFQQVDINHLDDDLKKRVFSKIQKIVEQVESAQFDWILKRFTEEELPLALSFNAKMHNDLPETVQYTVHRIGEKDVSCELYLYYFLSNHLPGQVFSRKCEEYFEGPNVKEVFDTAMKFDSFPYNEKLSRAMCCSLKNVHDCESKLSAKFLSEHLNRDNYGCFSITNCRVVLNFRDESFFQRVLDGTDQMRSVSSYDPIHTMGILLQSMDRRNAIEHLNHMMDVVNSDKKPPKDKWINTLVDFQSISLDLFPVAKQALEHHCSNPYLNDILNAISKSKNMNQANGIMNYVDALSFKDEELIQDDKGLEQVAKNAQTFGKVDPILANDAIRTILDFQGADNFEDLENQVISKLEQLNSMCEDKPRNIVDIGFGNAYVNPTNVHHFGVPIELSRALEVDPKQAISAFEDVANQKRSGSNVYVLVDPKMIFG